MERINSTFARIYDIVRRIPAGRLATYGQVARLAGSGAREVGYALAQLRDDDVPWHRVINAKGEISLRQGKELQRVLLEQEGVQFSETGRVDLGFYGWTFPPDSVQSAGISSYGK